MPTTAKKTRVIKPTRPDAPSINHAVLAESLAPDSLGHSLLLAARLLAAVLGGKSLAEVAGALDREPPGARAAAQDVVYGVLRQFGRGTFVLGRLMHKPLTHAETQALLLAALYRLETRPEAPHTIVDQAVQAAGLTGRCFLSMHTGQLFSFALI